MRKTSLSSGQIHLGCLYLAYDNDILDGTCFEDNANRILKTHIGDFHVENSKEVCIAACEGYQYAGTQYTFQCFCGDDEPDPALERPGECNYICPGNANETCGDTWRMNIYDISSGNFQEMKNLIWLQILVIHILSIYGISYFLLILSAFFVPIIFGTYFFTSKFILFK